MACIAVFFSKLGTSQACRKYLYHGHFQQQMSRGGHSSGYVDTQKADPPCMLPPQWKQNNRHIPSLFTNWTPRQKTVPELESELSIKLTWCTSICPSQNGIQILWQTFVNGFNWLHTQEHNLGLYRKSLNRLSCIKLPGHAQERKLSIISFVSSNMSKWKNLN